MRRAAVVPLVEDYDENAIHIVNCKSEMRLHTLETIEDKVETDSTVDFKI